jgi:glycosyltransferase 2 family protein
VVATVLIGWLIRSGSLDFKALRLFFDRPLLLVANLGLFTMGVVFGALRWRELLKLADVRMPLGRAIQLQFTALFFNTVIPGNVGGDVVKSVYAARETTAARKPTVFLIVFVERLLGLGGLVLVAGITTVLRGDVLWQSPHLRQLAMGVALLALVTLIGPGIAVLIVRRSGDRLEQWTGGATKIARLLNQLVAAARLVSAGPKHLAIALGLSMAMHACAMLLFTALTNAITQQDVSLSAVATIYPLGIITMILPVSPAGIGVGHVAFDRLFALIGLEHGATVFNVYIIGQLSPCLLGVFPYLALKREGTLPATAPADVSATPNPSQGSQAP